MSIWTNVLGVVRFSDEKLIDLSKVFIAEDFCYKPIRGCNMPYGTEGSIQWYAQKENVEYSGDGYGNEVAIYLRQIVFYGDLRDFEAKDCKIIREWWSAIPEKLGQHCWIRDAILNVRPGNGKRFTLTQKNMIDNGHII